jgi:hypothetical protein
VSAAEIRIEMEEAGDGWRASVSVHGDGSMTHHRVKLPQAMLEALAPSATPEALVRASFEFLLEREPKESILREFEISVIGFYFPDYEQEIGARAAALTKASGGA